MDFDTLRAFITVAKHQSFTIAAEQLFLTQSAISKRVLLLEQSMDIKLFDRIGHRTRLTEAGRILLPRAEKILLDVDDSRRALRNLNSEVSGTLAIGTSHHIGLHRLPRVLKKFNQRYPQVNLSIQFLDSEHACNAVARGELELGIVTLPLKPAANLLVNRIWTDQLTPVVGSHHKLAKIKFPSLKTLVAYDAILPARGTFTRELLERAVERIGVQLKSSMSTNYLETIKMLVSVGLGWSVLPHTMLDKNLKILRISELEFERPLGVVRHANHSLSNAAMALINILELEKN